ncbi:hypothetical protein JCM8202_004496 [Rhodotorula sphaerocarpa]
MQPLEGSTTTTVTQLWELDKYSRSRPRSPAPGRSGSPAADRIEWDHYAQPRLVLRLEATYHSAAAALSLSLPPARLLLTVTYDPLYRDRDRDRSTAAPASVDRPSDPHGRHSAQSGAGSSSTNSNHSHSHSHSSASALVLDAIDLAAFSTPQIRAATPADQLPLKAVYRDAILGLRYLVLPMRSTFDPAPSSQLDRARELNADKGEFRRVQAKFASVRERERFVEAIRGIVPVKPAAEPAPAPAAAAAGPDSEARLDGTQQREPKSRKKTKAGGSKSAAAAASASTPAGRAPASRPSTLRKTATRRTRNAEPLEDAGPRRKRTRIEPTAATPALSGYNPTDFAPAASATTSAWPHPRHDYNYDYPPGLARPSTSYRADSARQWGAPPPPAPAVPLPASLASLLPNLHASHSASRAVAAATTLAPDSHGCGVGAREGGGGHAAWPGGYRTASLALAALGEQDLEGLLREALMEEGFEELVKRVQGTLAG